jgi:hypothetical protein
MHSGNICVDLIRWNKAYRSRVYIRLIFEYATLQNSESSYTFLACAPAISRQV